VLTQTPATGLRYGGWKRAVTLGLGAFAFSLVLVTGMMARAQIADEEDENNKPAMIAHGHDVFNKICAQCHSDKKGVNRVGPSLYGVVGRKAGTEPGFAYSDAMKNFGKVWTSDELTHYLWDPQAWVPGVAMHFAGLKRKWNRHAVIAYLETLHD
jgi:cytochrome c